MNKKIIFLLLVCIGIAVGIGVILFYEHPPSTPSFTPPPCAIETSIAEINSNPSAWVNKTVVIESNLNGPWGYIPENAPPYGYRLTGQNDTVFIGVSWSGDNHQYYSEKAILVGIVKKGSYYRFGKYPACYYIEAQEVQIS